MLAGCPLQIIDNIFQYLKMIHVGRAWINVVPFWFWSWKSTVFGAKHSATLYSMEKAWSWSLAWNTYYTFSFISYNKTEYFGSQAVRQKSVREIASHIKSHRWIQQHRLAHWERHLWASVSLFMRMRTVRAFTIAVTEFVCFRGSTC